MPEKLIYLEEIGHAFITKSDDDNCPKGGLHDFSSAVLTYLTRRGEYRHINQDKYLMPGSTRPRPEHWRMRIVGGETACIKCGCPYTSAHNPYYFGEQKNNGKLIPIRAIVLFVCTLCLLYSVVYLMCHL